MTIQETIYKRKSTRSFTADELSPAVLENIKTFARTIKPLYPDIKTEFQIVGKDKIKSILPWKAPHNLVIFSEMKDGCYENIGFIFQQVDLYIQSQGIGCCWIGMGKLSIKDGEEVAAKPSDSSLKFVIFITFGKSKNAPHREMSAYKRKTLAEISNQVDKKLEPARLAPSGKNIQPWYFLHDGNLIHAYCTNPGMLKSQKDANINRIDIGCALSHLYVSNPAVFEFFLEASPKEINGYYYIGSIQM